MWGVQWSEDILKWVSPKKSEVAALAEGEVAPNYYFDNATNTNLSFTVAKITVNNGSLVTIGVWTYKTSTNKVAKLIIKRNTFIGMSADVVANNSSASLNTWTKIEATFTPNAKGVVEIELRGESTTGTSDYIYFDDLEVAQA